MISVRNIKVFATAGALLVSTVGFSVAQAQCADGIGNPSVPRSAPNQDFLETADGTVLHVPSELVWQRCALGQTWNGASCDGTPQLLSFGEALQAAASHEQANAQDWRLPNRNELGSIVEDRCELPALDSNVFPDAPAGEHWSSSPYTGGSDEAWAVDFDDGRVAPASIQTFLPVRLVREGRTGRR
ncbi:MAG: DUF1566 domain-containing protein [Pseudomonadota bacterium]